MTERTRLEAGTSKRRGSQGWRVRPATLVRAVGVWGLLAVVAVANGVAREALLTPRIGPDIAHVVGTGTAIVALLAVITWYFARSSLEHTDGELLVVGGLWVVMTVAFEFGFGHYVMGHPWSRLLADYDLLAGRVWVFVLVALLIGPTVIGRWLGQRTTGAGG